MRSVEVHNNQGKVICKIEMTPMLKDLLLSFTPVSREWKDPLAVERWAWRTARSILVWVQLDISDRWYIGLSKFGALCPACWKFSVIPVSKSLVDARMVYVSEGKGEYWFSCLTQSCPMQRVIVPKILIFEAKEGRLDFPETSADDPTMKLLIHAYTYVKASINLGIEPNREEFEQSVENLLKEAGLLP